MQYMRIMRKPLALAMTIMLTLVLLLPAARPAMAHDNRVALSRSDSARPIPPSWRPSWMSC
jgi:hypothetical protein